ncbi:MAG: SulP family inorganic anion transporter [Acidimicrobiales bacterium]
MPPTAPSPAGALGRFIPALGWMPAYRPEWLRRDIVGGLAAGAVVIPQAMAYATVARLPAEYGLYTCMVPMITYVFLGGSRVLSLSTTSTVALLSGSTLMASSIAAGSDDPGRALASLTILVGLLLLVARLFRLGSVVNNISEATLTGIKLGVGLTVAGAQLPKLLGVPADPDAGAFFGEVRDVMGKLGDLSWPTFALSAGTIVGVVLLNRFLPRLPAPLVAAAAGILLVMVGHVDRQGVALITPVPSGLPTPVLPAIDGITSILVGAVAIALMCFMETASVAHALHRREDPPIDNNQELVANGLANVFGGFFRALPAAGGFSQSAMNEESGSRTQVSELVTAGLAIACALFLGGVLSDLPAATLGALVVVAVLGLISPADYLRYWRLDRTSFWVAVITALAGLLFGLVEAVLVGVALTLVTLLHELNVIGVTELQLDRDGDGDELLPAGDATHPVEGLLVLRVDGPLYTANVRSISQLIHLHADRSHARVVVVDLTAVSRTSITVVDELTELHRSLDHHGVDLWWSSVTPEVAAVAAEVPEWAELEANGLVFATGRAAVRRYQADPPPGRAERSGAGTG